MEDYQELSRAKLLRRNGSQHNLTMGFLSLQSEQISALDVKELIIGILYPP